MYLLPVGYSAAAVSSVFEQDSSGDEVDEEDISCPADPDKKEVRESFLSLLFDGLRLISSSCS